MKILGLEEMERIGAKPMAMIYITPEGVFVARIIKERGVKDITPEQYRKFLEEFDLEEVE